MISFRIFYFFLFSIILFTGCASVPHTSGSLGTEDSRRIVIIGENIQPNLAYYYQKKYEALVWFTPFEGRVVNNANNFLQSGIGPSVAMRSLVKELKSINYSVGQWSIIVPKIGEKYFLTALKNMKDGSLVKARGIVVLIDSTSNKEMEVQLRRVTHDNFIVAYEFHKD